MAAERLATVRGHLQPVPASMAGMAYTLDDTTRGVLSARDRQFYEDNGYFVVRKLVDPADLERYRQRFVDLCSGTIEKPPFMIMMKDVALAHKKKIESEHDCTKIQDFFEDDVLFSYCQQPRILDYVKCFTGPNVKAMHTMLINKPPGVGLSGRHPAHQDLVYFPFRPADRIVCSWTAMEHVHRDNGCLFVIPGSHKSELKHHGYPDWEKEGGVNKVYYGIQDITKDDLEKRVHLEMQPGDTVFFHPLLHHGSGANRTQGFRKAISCHYASANCDYLQDVRGTPHENLAEEIKDMAKKKLKGDTAPDYQFIWKVKGRLVCGEEGTL